ncbi:phage antirepressor KilAC domain-containing protein [Bradyrhizobium genosp. A]|uniref:phage antirepressor KilAC domain-containing protein n=1 Tax=Bradyrhizobium genosp. A TaxID=83626 RepID=UPI003CEE8D0A
MNELIKITSEKINGGAVQTVNARDLHAFLESKRDFSDWMRERIALYDFQQGSDFVVVPQICGGVDKDGYPRASKRNEYFVTLDMAKEIAMVERSDKGRQARQYFIECERRANAAPAFDPTAALSDPAWLRNALGVYTEKVIALEGRVSELAPKADALDRIATAQGSLNVTDAAKALQVRPKDLFSYLSSHGWIYRRAGSDHWLGYQTRVQAGDLEHKVKTVLRADGSEKITEQVRVTALGLSKLAKLFPPAVSKAA